jgi:hypothetical protein
MSFAVKFDDSAIYTLSSNQDDTNKLWGFSDGFDHLVNSARIGWRYYEGNLQLMAYAHVAGIFRYEELTIIQPGEEVTCRIKILGTHYVFAVKDVVIEIPRVTSGDYVTGYQLFPYFGGDEVAPQDIRIEIK